MGRHDWYRNRTWDASVAADFNARIARSRQPWSKWQYLTIQAGMLVGNGFVDDGLALYRRSLTDVKDVEPSWRRVSLTHIGEILMEQGKHAEAHVALRDAIKACSYKQARIHVTDEREPEALLKKLTSTAPP